MSFYARGEEACEQLRRAKHTNVVYRKSDGDPKELIVMVPRVGDMYTVHPNKDVEDYFLLFS